MNPYCPTFYLRHRLGDAATYPIARQADRLAALLLLAGEYPAASSRLAIRSACRTLGHVQPPLLGLNKT
jgi:hypothetical protein